MLSKSYTIVEEDLPLYCFAQGKYDCRISLTILLGACILFSLTYTCLSRIQVFQPAGHLPDVELSCWACNKNLLVPHFAGLCGALISKCLHFLYYINIGSCIYLPAAVVFLHLKDLEWVNQVITS